MRILVHDSRLHDARLGCPSRWMDRWHITETSMHRLSDHGVHTQRKDIRWNDPMTSRPSTHARFPVGRSVERERATVVGRRGGWRVVDEVDEAMDGC